MAAPAPDDPPTTVERPNPYNLSADRISRHNLILESDLMGLSSSIPLRSRFRGCLLGGAVGDALGAPVEFLSHAEIVRRFGPAGIRDYVPAYGRLGAMTDDTQMTLFTAEGLIRASSAGRHSKNPDVAGCVHHAYLRWLMTQGERLPKVPAAERVSRDGWLIKLPELQSRRAPGMTCLSALSAGERPAKNQSKGCGGVMRIAPAGLWTMRLERSMTFHLGSECAELTHGHPSGFLSAAFLAVMIAEIAGGEPLESSLDTAERLLSKARGHEETLRSVQSARRKAAGGASSALELESLGGGWVGEEALAIAIFCSLVAESFEDAIALAVNHGGDSDSTGAITGNILGALGGEEAIPDRWLENLELKEEIAQLADDLADLHEGALDFEATDRDGERRYPPT